MKTLYRNGRVFTGALPLCSAFVVEDGRFLYAGDEAGAPTCEERVDLGGAFVSPGFIDSHMHLLNYGQALSIAPLHAHTESLEAMLDCLRAAAPASGWILGRGWNQDYFSDCGRMPNRHDLDRVSREVPVCAVRACGHVLSVNSAALARLGISGESESPIGGEIVMENGEPNGIFLDAAMDLVLTAIPDPDREELKAMLRLACQRLNAFGVTACHSDDLSMYPNLPWREVYGAFSELESAGELSVRVYEQAYFTEPEALRGFLSAGHMTGRGSELFRTGPLKLLADGSLGARTALLARDYADKSGERGLAIFRQERLDELVATAHAAGMQIAVHCIGDGALDMVLDSFEKALTARPRADHRHGIVHCQIMRPDQWERMAALKLRVYAQSIFLDYDIHIVAQRVGAELAASSYSWKSLMKLGVPVSNGSDCPVEEPNVLAGIQCAVTRCTLGGEGPYLPAEAFSVEEALRSFTVMGAEAAFAEGKQGEIAPGIPADFVLLGADPFETAPEAIKDIPVLATYLGGKKVY